MRTVDNGVSQHTVRNDEKWAAFAVLGGIRIMDVLAQEWHTLLEW